MNNLFIVGTPSHYFNLLECIKKFDLKTSESKLLFLNNNSQSSDEIIDNFIKKYINTNEWKSVQRIPLWDSISQKIYSIHNIKIMTLFVFKILRMSLFKKYNYLVVSQVDQFYSKCFYFIASANKIISLDEGNAVFRIVDQRNSNKRSSLFMPKRIIFFSSYSIKVERPDIVVRCNYDFSKNKLKTSKVNHNELWFIGSPYIEDRLINKDLYWTYIRKIRNDYKGKSIKYFPHRREKKKYLKILEKDYQFSIIKIDCPIEFFLLDNDQLPRIISGFLSAALLNLRNITNANIQIHSYFIDSNNIESFSGELIKIKNQYLNSDIEVIDL